MERHYDNPEDVKKLLQLPVDSVELIRCLRAYDIDIRLREMEEHLEIHRANTSIGGYACLNSLKGLTFIWRWLPSCQVPLGRPGLLSVPRSSACNI
jgi:hypothetical protein